MKRPSKRAATCGSKLEPGEILISDAGFNSDEHLVLSMCRLYFQSFAVPESQAWSRVFPTAEHRFGPKQGPDLAARVFEVVQELRFARHSHFRYSNPLCGGCSRILTEHERQLMGIFIGLRTGHQSDVFASAMVLCEGNASRNVIARMRVLCTLFDGSHTGGEVSPQTSATRH